MKISKKYVVEFISQIILLTYRIAGNIRITKMQIALKLHRRDIHNRNYIVRLYLPLPADKPLIQTSDTFGIARYYYLISL